MTQTTRVFSSYQDVKIFHYDWQRFNIYELWSTQLCQLKCSLSLLFFPFLVCFFDAALQCHTETPKGKGLIHAFKYSSDVPAPCVILSIQPVFVCLRCGLYGAAKALQDHDPGEPPQRARTGSAALYRPHTGHAHRGICSLHTCHHRSVRNVFSTCIHLALLPPKVNFM